MANLKTDYKDDILDSTQNTRRKFRMIPNDDGTFSFEDVTDYLQYGDSFGALDLNAITNAIMNECLKRIDVVDNTESTATDLPLSANMGRKIVNDFTPQKLNGTCVFSPNQSGYIVSSMIPLVNADKKNITITNNVTILGDEVIDIGASRFSISAYGTGFILYTKDTTAIQTCANKGVSFDFTVS